MYHSSRLLMRDHYSTMMIQTLLDLTQSRNMAMDSSGLSTLLSFPFLLPRPTWKAGPSLWYQMRSQSQWWYSIATWSPADWDRSTAISIWGYTSSRPLCSNKVFLCLFFPTGEHPLRLVHSFFSPESSSLLHGPQTVQPHHVDALNISSTGEVLSGLSSGKAGGKLSSFPGET